MGCTPEQALYSKYVYYAVFNNDLTEYYGLTSEDDKEVIEEYHSGLFVFKEFDLNEQYVDCLVLENRLGLDSNFKDDEDIVRVERLDSIMELLK